MRRAPIWECRGRSIPPPVRSAKELPEHAQLAQKEAAFLDLILKAYRAEKTDGFATFHGKKAGRLVSGGPVNLLVTRLYVEEVIAECRQKRITRVDILGLEFEMGLFPNVLDEARSKGINIAPKYSCSNCQCCASCSIAFLRKARNHRHSVKNEVPNVHTRGRDAYGPSP